MGALLEAEAPGLGDQHMWPENVEGCVRQAGVWVGQCLPSKQVSGSEPWMVPADTQLWFCSQPSH